MGPQLKVSSDKVMKPRIESATPGSQGKRFIDYTRVANLHVHLYGQDPGKIRVHI